MNAVNCCLSERKRNSSSAEFGLYWQWSERSSTFKIIVDIIGETLWSVIVPEAEGGSDAETGKANF